MIRATVTMVMHSLRRMRALLGASCAILALFQVLLTLMARELETSGTFRRLASFIPEFMRPILDPSFTAALSFTGMATFGFAHLVVVGYLTALAIAAGTESAGEIESGFVDLVMSRPLARGVIVARSALVVVIQTVTLVASMTAGLWFGLLVLTPANSEAPAWRVIGSLAVNLTFVIIAWGAIAAAVGSTAKRRAAAASITGLLALAAFLLDYMGRIWDPVKPIAKLSPYHYYSPFPIVTGGSLPSDDLAVLAALAVAGFAIAFALYVRRDL